ncbi:hypothetical protein [Methanoregula sp.]|jgi:hypothetical protein|uniref:hypothetical protein n=1 Tax=Methanoregula sp. TaxID=2052170 RepID=UPI003561A2A1
MKTAKRPTYSFLILVIGLILINTLLAWLSLKISQFISPSLSASVSMVYIAVAFMLIFTLWFGMYGAIAAYVGTFIGTGLLSGMPVTTALYFSLSGLWQVLIPLIAFRIFDVHVDMESKRDLFHLILFGTIINNLIGAAWGSVTLAIGGINVWSQVPSTFLLWFIGNVIVTIIIVPLVLRHFTPRVEKSKVFVKNYWY